MNRSVLRSALVVPFVVAAVACGGSGGESATDAPRSLDAGSASSAEGGPSASSDVVADGGTAADGATTPGATVSVHGTVNSYADAPIAGRSVRVVDANSKQTDVVTDATGGFAVPGVVTPYDVRISPEGLSDAAWVYVGMKDAAPHLHGELATAWVAQTFAVGVLMATACPGCEVRFVSASAHGEGSASATFQPGSSVANTTLRHQFISDGAPSEPTTIRVLVNDSARTWFRYAEASVTAVAGRTSPGGLFTPDLVPVHPFSVSLQSAGIPANWKPSVFAGVGFTDGSAFNLLNAAGLASASVNNVPAIPGAALVASGILSDPITDSDPTIGEGVQAWKGSLPVSTASVVLVPTAPLHDVVPGPKSTVSRSGPGLSWTAPSGTVTGVFLVDVTHGRALANILVDGNSVPWKRLEVLGIDAAPSEYRLVTSTTPHADLAALVTSDATKRIVAGSPDKSEGINYQAWTFTLTP